MTLVNLTCTANSLFNATGDSELLHELIMDRIIKMGIVVGAVIVVLISMVIIYKKVGNKQ